MSFRRHVFRVFQILVFHIFHILRKRLEIVAGVRQGEDMFEVFGLDAAQLWFVCDTKALLPAVRWAHDAKECFDQQTGCPSVVVEICRHSRPAGLVGSPGLQVLRDTDIMGLVCNSIESNARGDQGRAASRCAQTRATHDGCRDLRYLLQSETAERPRWPEFYLHAGVEERRAEY